MSLSVLLVDDHEVVRRGLRALLEREEDLTLVAEVGTAEEALAQIRSHGPDVAVVDLALPGTNGLELTRQVTAGCPSTKVLVLSMHNDEAYVLEAFRSGALGYILKEAPASEFVEGVRAVGGGRHYLSSELSKQAIEAALNDPDDTPRGAFASLTRRDLQVLGLVAEGLTSRNIATRLAIGVRTVETHRAHILHKLGLRTHSDLIGYAVRHNLLTTPLSVGGAQ
jgi:two-component system response regulator NreC